MAPKQQGPNPDMKKNARLRIQVNRVKAEMGKIREDRQGLSRDQRKIRARSGEIDSQLDRLKRETEVIMKRTASTQAKLVLMFMILKSREGGYSTEAAMLTNFLREVVAKE